MKDNNKNMKRLRMIAHRISACLGKREVATSQEVLRRLGGDADLDDIIDAIIFGNSGLVYTDGYVSRGRQHLVFGTTREKLGLFMMDGIPVNSVFFPSFSQVPWYHPVRITIDMYTAKQEGVVFEEKQGLFQSRCKRIGCHMFKSVWEARPIPRNAGREL